MDYKAYSKIKLRQEERIAIMIISMVDTALETQFQKLDRKLSDCKAFKRNRGMLKYILRDITTHVLKDQPTDVIRHLLRQANDYCIDLRLKGPIREINDDIVMPRDTLRRFLDYIICDHCATCLATPEEAAKCELRRLLINYIDEPDTQFDTCGYRDACKIDIVEE